MQSRLAVWVELRAAQMSWSLLPHAPLLCVLVPPSAEERRLLKGRGHGGGHGLPGGGAGGAGGAGGDGGEGEVGSARAGAAAAACTQWPKCRRLPCELSPGSQYQDLCAGETATKSY